MNKVICVFLIVAIINFTVVKPADTTPPLVDDLFEVVDCVKGCVDCVSISKDENGKHVPICRACSGRVHRIISAREQTCIDGIPIENCVKQMEIEITDKDDKVVKKQKCLDCDYGYNFYYRRDKFNNPTGVECKAPTIENSYQPNFSSVTDYFEGLGTVSGEEKVNLCKEGYKVSADKKSCEKKDEGTYPKVQDCLGYSETKCEFCKKGYKPVHAYIIEPDKTKPYIAGMCLPAPTEVYGCLNGLRENGCNQCDYFNGFWIKSIILDNISNDASMICTNEKGDLYPTNGGYYQKLENM